MGVALAAGAACAEGFVAYGVAVQGAASSASTVAASPEADQFVAFGVAGNSSGSTEGEAEASQGSGAIGGIIGSLRGGAVGDQPLTVVSSPVSSSGGGLLSWLFGDDEGNTQSSNAFMATGMRQQLADVQDASPQAGAGGQAQRFVATGFAKVRTSPVTIAVPTAPKEPMVPLLGAKFKRFELYQVVPVGATGTNPFEFADLGSDIRADQGLTTTSSGSTSCPASGTVLTFTGVLPNLVSMSAEIRVESPGAANYDISNANMGTGPLDAVSFIWDSNNFVTFAISPNFTRLSGTIPDTYNDGVFNFVLRRNADNVVFDFSMSIDADAGGNITVQPATRIARCP